MPFDDLPRDFIPSRHGAARSSAHQLLGRLRLLVGRNADPTPEHWRRIGLALMRGDEPMDRLLDWMVAQGLKDSRALFEQALERGIGSIPDAPAPLREFFALIDRRPDWVDMPMVAEGAKVTGCGGMDYFFINRDLALMGGYQASAFNKTLLLTGALKKGPVRRLAETVQWFLDCTEEGGMERFGIGFKSTLRVRLIHALVRRHVQKLPEWRMGEWGLPVNQIDMAATALAFPLTMLMGGRALGVIITARESQAAMHHGRYVCWLMGVEEQWQPRNEREGRRLLYQLSLSITHPDDTSVQLGQALMNEPLQRPYGRFAKLKARYHYERHLSVSSLFLGRKAMRNLGLPDNRLPWFPLLRLPRVTVRHLLSHVIPGARERLARKGRQEVIDFMSTITGAEKAQVGAAAQHLAGKAH